LRDKKKGVGRRNKRRRNKKGGGEEDELTTGQIDKREGRRVLRREGVKEVSSKR
jgi:hypothetical protein